MQKLALFTFLIISQTLMAQNVGIGTTTPQSKLHILSTGNEVARLDAGNPYLSLYSNGVYKGYFWRSPNSIEIGSASGSGLPITLAPDGFQRVFITSLGNAGIGTSSPVARLHVADSSVLFSATGAIPVTPGNIPLSGAGRRMMWFPDKAAFRAGYTDGTHWDISNVGGYSVAMGYSTTASGFTSTALGNFTVASEYGATAMGYSSSASGFGATAIGMLTVAKATGSLSIGVLNDNTDNPDPFTTAPSDRIFQLGNGENLIRSNAITVLRNGNTGIGITDPAYILDVGARMRLRSSGGGSAGAWLNNSTNTTSPAFIGMRSDNLVGFFGSAAPNSGWGFLMNTVNGNVGIATDNPAAQLEVNGYTKLGSDAPVIKMKKLTSTTSATEGVGITIPHGLNYLKILSVSVIVQNAAGTWVGENSGYAGSNFRWDFNSFNVEVDLVFGSSANILSKPVKVLIIYEE